MDPQTELRRTVDLALSHMAEGSEIAPQKLIDLLCTVLKCSFEHGRELVFEAIDLGMLRLTPSYAIAPAN